MATTNPFVIYDFYDMLKNVIKSNYLSKRQIWNCDEMGFPHDPNSCKVVGPRGKVLFKVTPGPSRQNTTVLAACSASGEVLPPMIIFQGTWKGSKPHEGFLYAVSDSGWMTSKVFLEWFQKFARSVTQRPLLLLLDGHVSHVSMEVISTAVEKNIIIVKLPPHATDVLQPLDVTCFGPLKQKWSKLLAARSNISGSRSSLTKSSFVDELAHIWYACFSESNIKSGFSSTGIFPVDRSKYPTERFNPRLLRRHQR